jgi:hypothetical protein
VIDFRYHLVSIVAVFLALAIGLVVGATALPGKTVSTLDSQSRVEEKQIDSLRAENGSLQDQIGSAQEFAQAAAPVLLSGKLTGQKVVLVTAPGADSSIVSGVTSAVQAAGAKVTGQVGLQASFFDTSSRSESALSDLAQRLAPVGYSPASPPAQLASNTKIAAQEQAAELIAAALVTPASQALPASAVTTAADLPSAQVEQILNGFAQQGFLQVGPASGATTMEAATLAVVVIPTTPPSDGDTDPANQALIGMAYQLAEVSSGVVVAGPLAGSGSGSAINELINGNTGATLSSVDDADTEQGQIFVAWALSGLLAGQKPQPYGVGSGIVPDPAPSSSSSPDTTKHKTSG